MGAAIAFPGFILTLVAFILLLLTTLSVPIIKSIFFLEIYIASAIDVASVSGSLRLGTLGYCSTGVSAKFSTSGILGEVGTSEVLIPGGCTRPKLGYTLNDNLFTSLDTIAGHDLGGISSTLIKALTYVMVIQPIAAGFALISLAFAFSAWCGRSRAAEICALLITLLSSLFAWLACIITIVLFSVAKSRIDSVSEGVLKGKLGGGVWMSLVAAILLSIAICFTCIGSVGPYSHAKREERRRSREMQAGGAPAGDSTYQPGGGQQQYPMTTRSTRDPTVVANSEGTTAWQRWKSERAARKGSATY